MIIRFFDIVNREFVINNAIPILEIENNMLLYKILEQLSNGDSNDCIIGLEEKGTQISNDGILMVYDLFNYSSSSNTILNRLYKYIESNKEDYYDDYQRVRKSFEDLAANIENFIINFEIDSSSVNDFDIKKILKFFNIEPITGNTFKEKILNLILINSKLLAYKCICFVNIKGLINETDLVEIYKYSLYYNIDIIFLENKHSLKTLKYEKKIFIDEDDFVLEI